MGCESDAKPDPPAVESLSQTQEIADIILSPFVLPAAAQERIVLRSVNIERKAALTHEGSVGKTHFTLPWSAVKAFDNAAEADVGELGQIGRGQPVGRKEAREFCQRPEHLRSEYARR